VNVGLGSSTSKKEDSEKKEKDEDKKKESTAARIRACNTGEYHKKYKGKEKKTALKKTFKKTF